MVAFGRSGCLRAKVVVFGQSVCIRTKWLYSGKMVVFGKNWLLSGKSGCNRAKVFLYRAKVVVFG